MDEDARRAATRSRDSMMCAPRRGRQARGLRVPGAIRRRVRCDEDARREATEASRGPARCNDDTSPQLDLGPGIVPVTTAVVAKPAPPVDHEAIAAPEAASLNPRYTFDTFVAGREAPELGMRRVASRSRCWHGAISSTRGAQGEEAFEASEWRPVVRAEPTTSRADPCCEAEKDPSERGRGGPSRRSAARSRASTILRARRRVRGGPSRRSARVLGEHDSQGAEAGPRRTFSPQRARSRASTIRGRVVAVELPARRVVGDIAGYAMRSPARSCS
jgi:hypothetical protein